METQLKTTLQRIKYTSELLYETMRANSITIYTMPDRIYGDSLITFNCKCGQSTTKAFNNIVKYGPNCKGCGKSISKERRKQTFLKNYGVECGLQSTEIKNKIKKTNLEKYGVECTLSSKPIRDKITATFIENYGVDNPNKCKTTIEKTKATNLQRYGVTNPNQLDEIKEKTKQTNLEKYGVSCVLQTDEVRDKVKQTCLEKYGVSNPLNSDTSKEKCKNTVLQKYGIVNYMDTNEFREKRKNTMLEKYGVEHALQNPELFDKQQKTSYSLKEYIMPSGKIIKIQGFEHYALNILLNMYAEEEIKVGRKGVPRIQYFIGDKVHYYYPDMYIPKENKIIEVKSEWTYNKQLERNHIKCNACKLNGYTFQWYIFDKFGKQIDNTTLGIENG